MKRRSANKYTSKISKRDINFVPKIIGLLLFRNKILNKFINEKSEFQTDINRTNTITLNIMLNKSIIQILLF